jgi:hypothetical protein
VAKLPDRRASDPLADALGHVGCDGISAGKRLLDLLEQGIGKAKADDFAAPVRMACITPHRGTALQGKVTGRRRNVAVVTVVTLVGLAESW